MYVDDRGKNLAAAEKLGMKAVMLDSIGELYTGDKVNSLQELLERVLSN